jgi:hypothetical protein
MSEDESVTLYEFREGPTWYETWGFMNSAGDLVVRSYDAGPLVEQLIGTWEYEYSFTVSAADKDKMLIQLLKERFAEEKFSIQSWLNEHQIEYTFWNWWTYK